MAEGLLGLQLSSSSAAFFASALVSNPPPESAPLARDGAPLWNRVKADIDFESDLSATEASQIQWNKNEKFHSTSRTGGFVRMCNRTGDAGNASRTGRCGDE